MAHECPECGCDCHCNGDIDDICFGVPDHHCKHCEEREMEENDDVTDEMIEEAMGDMNTPEAIKSWNECSAYIMKHKMTPNLDAPEA